MADDGIPWDTQLSATADGRLLQATLDRVKAASFPGIEKENIVIRKLAWIFADDELKTPCIILSPAPETVNWQDGTNERDDVGYAVFASIVLANGLDISTRGMGLQLLWRTTLRRMFQNLSTRRFTELAAFDDGSLYLRSSIEAGERFIEQSKVTQRDAQYLVIRHYVREPRT